MTPDTGGVAVSVAGWPVRKVLRTYSREVGGSLRSLAVLWSSGAGGHCLLVDIAEDGRSACVLANLNGDKRMWQSAAALCQEYLSQPVSERGCRVVTRGELEIILASTKEGC
jgi:hypothetical protein